MYLSKISWKLAGKSTYQLVSDCYELHRNIMSAFPNTDGNAREKFNVLYHLMINDDQAVLLVQSTVEADWLKGFGGITRDVFIKKREIPSAFYDFKNGEPFWFKLVANPSKKIACDGKTNSRRVFLIKDVEQMEWLKRKSEQSGFSLIEEQIKIRQLDNSYGRKKGIVFQKVEFEGMLRVCNEHLFEQAFCKGIGSEKAFGCGMLLIKRVKA